MAIIPIDSGTAAPGTAEATAVVLTLSRAITAGTYCLVCGSTNDTNRTLETPTDNSGKGVTWAKVATVASANGSCGMWIAYCPEGLPKETQITIGTGAKSNATRDACAMEVPGLIHPESATDRVATNNHAAQAAWDTGETEETTQAEEIAIYMAVERGSEATTSTPPEGWTELHDFQSSGRCMTTGYKQLAAKGKQKAAGTFSSSSGAWTAIIATFKAAPTEEESKSVTVEAPAAVAKAVAAVPTIETSSNVTVEPPAAVVKAVAAAPNIESGSNATVEPPSAVAKAVAAAPTIETSSTVTIEPPAAVAKAVAPAPLVTAETAGEETGPRIFVVREHVPARLAVIIRASDGTRIGRWSQGAPNMENVFFGLTKAGEMPGGHTDFSCTLTRDPKHSYPDLATFARVELQGAGGEVLWSGTIRQQPRNGDNGTIEVKAVGDKQLLEDSDEIIGPGFIDSDLSKWGEPSSQRKIDTLGFYNPNQEVSTGWQGDGASAPSIVFGLSYENGHPLAEQWYSSGGVPIGKLMYDFATIGGTLVGFHSIARLGVTDLGAGIAYSGTDHANTSANQQTLNGGWNALYALIQCYYEGEYAGAGVDHKAWRNLRIIGDQGLALQGTWPNIGFLAKQMIPYIVEGSGLTTKDELLDDDGFVISQAWFSDPATRMAKLLEVTKYGALDPFVFNDRIFQYRIPGSYGRRWRLESGSIRPREGGPDGQRIWDRFMVSRQDVDGTTKYIGYPGSGAETEDARLQSSDPRNAAVAQDNPRGKLIAINGKCGPDEAIETALRFKEEAEQLDQSGEVTISGHVQDVASGAWYPSAYVQPGDYVAGPGSTDFHKITGASYSDDSKSVSCPVGAPPEGGLAAIEARFGAKLIERGAA